MICPACHGARAFPPCAECGGCGFAYCCEGALLERSVAAREQADHVALEEEVRRADTAVGAWRPGPSLDPVCPPFRPKELTRRRVLDGAGGVVEFALDGAQPGAMPSSATRSMPVSGLLPRPGHSHQSRAEFEAWRAEQAALREATMRHRRGLRRPAGHCRSSIRRANQMHEGDGGCSQGDDGRDPGPISVP
jgi:hypothetical protein